MGGNRYLDLPERLVDGQADSGRITPTDRWVDGWTEGGII